MGLTADQVRQAGPQLKRQIKQRHIQCDAGTMCGDGVLCGIERTYIGAEHAPSTLMNYCLARSDLCPTWRAYKEAVWAGRGDAFLDEAWSGE